MRVPSEHERARASQIVFELGMPKEALLRHPRRVSSEASLPSNALPRSQAELTGCACCQCLVFIQTLNVCTSHAVPMHGNDHYGFVRRRQQIVLKPLCLRGKEARHLTLGGIFLNDNPNTEPCVMRTIVFAIHDAKTNKEGQYQDWRAITPRRYLLQCPVVNLAILFLQRLCVQNGAPLPESMAELDNW